MSNTQHTAGDLVLVKAGVFIIDCKVIETKTSYGRFRLLVEPVAGCGQVWIEASRLVENRKTLAKA